MKKRLLSTLLALSLVLGLCPALPVHAEEHTHSYEEFWYGDGVFHYRICTDCGAYGNFERCADQGGDNQCDVCGAWVESLCQEDHAYDGTYWHSLGAVHYPECPGMTQPNRRRTLTRMPVTIICATSAANG